MTESKGAATAAPSISIVTPTYYRPEEMAALLRNLSEQNLLPNEVIVVDGAPISETSTEAAVVEAAGPLPFTCRYIRHSGGTAIQRNTGIEVAQGNFVAFIDDDIRLDPDFFERIIEVFQRDISKEVGGVVGFRTNENFRAEETARWRWYKRLGLLTTYEPGRYDYQSGYPINANLQAPFKGVRPVDFTTASCVVWRREVLDSGLRFDPFFRDYGVLEDAHFSLRARANWALLQCGEAHCLHLHSPRGRANSRKLGYKYVVNYYYVFRDVVKPLTWRHKFRFWRFQIFELLRAPLSAMRNRCMEDLYEASGRLQGFFAIMRGL